MDRIIGVLSDELRRELLKKPDLTLMTLLKAHDYCRTFEAEDCKSTAGAGKQRSIGIQSVNKVKEQGKRNLL